MACSDAAFRKESAYDGGLLLSSDSFPNLVIFQPISVPILIHITVPLRTLKWYNSE